VAVQLADYAVSAAKLLGVVCCSRHQPTILLYLRSNMISSTDISETAFGWEIILDLHNCHPEKIRSHDALVSFIVQLCNVLSVKRYNEPWVERFGLRQARTTGYTAVQLIETSSIVIHVSELTNSVYLNVFSCKNFDQTAVVNLCSSFFEAEVIQKCFLKRQ